MSETNPKNVEVSQAPAANALEGADVTSEQLLAALDALNKKFHQYFEARGQVWAGVQAAHPDDAVVFGRQAQNLDEEYLKIASSATELKSKIPKAG